MIGARRSRRWRGRGGDRATDVRREAIRRHPGLRGRRRNVGGLRGHAARFPLGVPKVMVSTVAGGDVSGYVGVKDIVMIPSIVDVAGINRISREVFARAAGAICGMVETEVPPVRTSRWSSPRCSATRRPASRPPRRSSKQAGYEVLVFHATGTGGRTMESLIEAGLVAGVLDITTTEWADELVGGVLAAGPTRLEAAARRRCRRSSRPAASTW